MSISFNIKYLREQYGLTQTELGKIAGVSDKAVSTWENGTAEPRMGAIQKMADYFKVSKSTIIEDHDEQGFALSLSSSQSKILSLFDSLNEEGQEMILAQAEAFVASGLYKKCDSIGLVQEEA